MTFDQAKELYQKTKKMQADYDQTCNSYDQLLFDREFAPERIAQDLDAMSKLIHPLLHAIHVVLGSLEDEFGPEISKT